jgi:hypothetical protein
MCLHFHRILASQEKDPLQTSLRFQGRKREEEVDETMMSGEQAVHNSAIETVAPTLLTRLKGKISPNKQTLRQQPLDQNVGAKVGVMMPIETGWTFLVNPAEFVDLGRHNVFKRADEAGMKGGAGKRVPQQIPSDFTLMFKQSSGTAGS